MSTTSLHLHQHVYAPMCTFIHAKTTIHTHPYTANTHKTREMWNNTGILSVWSAHRLRLSCLINTGMALPFQMFQMFLWKSWKSTLEATNIVTEDTFYMKLDHAAGQYDMHVHMRHIHIHEMPRFRLLAFPAYRSPECGHWDCKLLLIIRSSTGKIQQVGEMS